MMKKYKIDKNDYIKIPDGSNLYRLIALKDFSDVKKGDKGGYVKSEKNLSQNGDCWVYGKAWVWEDAVVFEGARVYGGARISGDARVFGYSWVFGRARISGGAWVYGDARILGDAEVFDNARVYGSAIVFGAAGIEGDARVFEDARIYGNAQIYDSAWVYGNARVYGEAIVYGDAEVYKDTRVSDGALTPGVPAYEKTERDVCEACYVFGTLCDIVGHRKDPIEKLNIYGWSCGNPECENYGVRDPSIKTIKEIQE